MMSTEEYKAAMQRREVALERARENARTKVQPNATKIQSAVVSPANYPEPVIVEP